MLREAINNALNQIEQFLEKQPIVKQYAKKLEATIGIRSGYIILGLLVTPLSLIFMPILLNTFTIVYPLFMSVKAIEKGKENRTRWLMYWLLFHIISLVEPICGWLLNMLTGFTLVKFIYLLWCMAPIQRNGCYASYRVLQPVIQKYVGAADDYIADVTGRVENVLKENEKALKEAGFSAQQALNGAANIVGDNYVRAR